MKNILILAGLMWVTNTASAQWTIKESLLKGSNLETVLKTNPYLVHVVPDKEWDSSNYAAPEDLQWFKEAKYGMFISFGLSTFVGKELSWGTITDRVLPDKRSPVPLYPKEVWTSWADSLKLEKFSKEELADIIRQSGMKYLVLVVKHHEGFHLWDTKYSEFKSTNSPYGKDFLKEVIDACHMAGIKVGIYYSQRDWYHPDYQPIDSNTVVRSDTPPFYKAKDQTGMKPGKRHEKYIEYQFNVVRELCTNYGKIDIFWFDANYWGGMFTADMWRAEELTRMIRKLQPGILINNRASIPGDFDTPEQRIGMFQNRRPWETCMTLCNTWSYSPTPVKSPLTVFQKLQSAAIGDGNLLLSWGMKWDGSWDEVQKETLIEVGKYLEKYGCAIYHTQGGPWLPRKWGGTTFREDTVYVHILKKPEEGTIFLPSLPGFKVKASEDMSGSSLKCIPVEGGYQIDLSSMEAITSPVVLKLWTDRKLEKSDVESAVGASSGENLTLLAYGKMHSGRTVRISLHGVKNVRKVVIKPEHSLTGNVELCFSDDGKNWKDQLKVELTEKKTEIPVTSYVAGALLDGKDTGYVEIRFPQHIGTAVSCQVYGE